MTNSVSIKPGALFTHLAPTAIALAGYFCIADVVLIAQCIYYNSLNARRAAETIEPAEDSPLLRRRRRSSSVGLPGSHRRRATHTESSMDPLRKIVTGEDDTPDTNPWLHNTLSLLAVFVVGFLGWFVSYQVGAWDNDEPGVPDSPDKAKSTLEVAGLALGYISAVLYLWYVVLRHRRVLFSLTNGIMHTAPEFPRSSRTTRRSHVKVSCAVSLVLTHPG